MKKRSLLIILFVLILCCSSLHGCRPGNDPDSNPSGVSSTPTGPINHGTLNMFEYDEYDDHVIITACNADYPSVIIPEVIALKPVTGFGLTFSRNFSIVSIHIPGSVQSIDERAFFMCDHLASVTIANGLKSIGKEAFSGCSSLAVARIPASVTQIADDAFQYCLNLVIFGEKGSAIHQYAERFQSINFRESQPEAQTNSVSATVEETVSAETTAAASAASTTTAPTRAATTVPVTTAAPLTELTETLAPLPETEPVTEPEPVTETEPETTTIPDEHEEY